MWKQAGHLHSDFYQGKKLISKSLNKTMPKSGSGSFLEITCKAWRKIIAWSYSIIQRVVFSSHWIILKSLSIKWLHRFEYLHKCIQSCLAWARPACSPTTRTEYHIMEKEQKSSFKRGASFRVSCLESSSSKGSSVPQKWCTMHQVLEGKSQIYTEGWLHC